MAGIVFVQNYPVQTIGIMRIPSALKEHGFSADIAFGSKANILNKIYSSRPRVVGFYCTTGFHHQNLRIAKEIKSIFKDKILTIFGGPHPILMPFDKFYNFLDNLLYFFFYHIRLVYRVNLFEKLKEGFLLMAYFKKSCSRK